MYEEIIKFIQSLYPGQNPVPLHAPVFSGNEKKYLNQCIDSTFVSYVGEFVTQFERMVAEFTGSKYAIAVVNGTVALQIALQLTGVQPDDEVITQPLTFVATANAISHCNAVPVFVDVDKDTMGLSPDKLSDWLKKNAIYRQERNGFVNKTTGRAISAIVPMHTFGFPCRIADIIQVANEYQIPVVEDAAESLGSFYQGKHTGTFGKVGILSFNGNKTITTGGGGMILTHEKEIAERAKYITTTAKVPHKWEFYHDQVGYNFRMPNVNAAIGVAQMEYINDILSNKRETAEKYQAFFEQISITCVEEMENTRANYWLNTILLNNRKERDAFLEESNSRGVMTRPAWRLMTELPMYNHCQTGNLSNSQFLSERIINLPSSVRRING